jgi:hypothetical protein
MAWTDSRIFTQAVLNPLTASAWSTTEPTTYGANGLSADTINVALFGTSVTPDRDAAVASTGYNTGTWTTGNEITGTNWAAGGQTLGTKAYTADLGGNVGVSFDAADVSVATVTLAAFFGDLTYDNTITAGTVAKQGLCFHYYGGTQSVTAGNLTIIWDVTGVFRFTV